MYDMAKNTALKSFIVQAPDVKYVFKYVFKNLSINDTMDK